MEFMLVCLRWSLESEVCLREIQTGHWSNEESRAEGFYLHLWPDQFKMCFAICIRHSMIQ